MKILETDRLILRRFSIDDAPFVLELLNDPAWLRFIGDRGVRTLDDARAYLSNGPIAMYDRLGFGLYLTVLKEASLPIGVCGLIRRDELEGVDLGFAFLPEFRSRGFAHEAASAVLEYGRDRLGLGRILAITSTQNHAAAGLLEKLGFRFDRMIPASPDRAELRLFSRDPDRS